MRALRVEMSPMRVGASLENNKFLRSCLLPIDHFSQSQLERVLWSLLRKLDSKSSFEGITRVKFIEACLAIHSLDTVFAPGVNSGPPIRVWWTASA